MHYNITVKVKYNDKFKLTQINIQVMQKYWGYLLCIINTTSFDNKTRHRNNIVSIDLQQDFNVLKDTHNGIVR